MRKGLGLGVRAALSSKTVFPKGINCFLRVTGDREVEFGPVFPPAHAFRKHKCSCKSIFRSCKTKPNFSTINPSGTRTNPLHISSIHSLLPVLVYPLLTLPPTNQTTTRAKGRHCFYFNFHKECFVYPTGFSIPLTDSKNPHLLDRYRLCGCPVTSSSFHMHSLSHTIQIKVTAAKKAP